jgi:hypothetical protein
MRGRLVTAHAFSLPLELPLLAEPHRPREGELRREGWRRMPYYDRAAHCKRRRLERRHEDDAFGALVQWAIVRYYLEGVRRSELAAWLGMAERSTQALLSGRAWGGYGLPILASLRRLGIGLKRGDWYSPDGRAAEIIRAQRAVMRRALERPDDPLVLADMRLLSAAWEDTP